ncbi:hypothetical protein [Acetilactobacillus jinshanensis]|uniref:Uncharacterized protein n=1 Tax=Acetilactobacillus jinshanensis TaxID=1720083 RepID=A0A4V1ALJ3_9LACO|nr:hypothetical protein [Acetilactobacillus jinshanensis]QBP17799.1 hypothetical protein ELX58_01130 [Acetilactobacillus jinshanensis]URL60662.1 hypothetical protein HGK75_01160 [uncultured bacterium]
MDLALSEYHVIVMKHTDDQYTVLCHDQDRYTIKTDTQKAILKDDRCLWDRTTMRKMIRDVGFQKPEITAILKKVTGFDNLSKCQFVWADQFKLN